MLLQLYAWALRLWQRPFIKFLWVGGLSTLAQFLALIALVESGLSGEVAASALGYLLGAVVNYLLNYYLTFASNQRHSQTLPKFVLVVAIGASVNTAVFALVARWIPWYWLSQCFATGASLVANFLLHKYWIYRRA